MEVCTQRRRVIGCVLKIGVYMDLGTGKTFQAAEHSKRRIIDLECMPYSKKAKLSRISMSDMSNQACILGRCISQQIFASDGKVNITG